MLLVPRRPTCPLPFREQSGPVPLQAIELAKNRTNERLRFRLADSNDFKDAHL
jgi:hypothetical protein